MKLPMTQKMQELCHRATVFDVKRYEAKRSKFSRS